MYRKTKQQLKKMNILVLVNGKGIKSVLFCEIKTFWANKIFSSTCYFKNTCKHKAF